MLTSGVAFARPAPTDSRFGSRRKPTAWTGFGSRSNVP